jgi:hypothetical protein
MNSGSTTTSGPAVVGKSLQQAEIPASNAETIVLDTIPPHPREKERLAWIENFERTWYPVVELRPSHRFRLKEYTMKKQKQEGQTVRCELCGKLCDYFGTQIHHPDHNDRNNHLSNIRVYCDVCNEAEKKVWLSQLMKARHHAPVDTTTLCSPKEKQTEAITEEQKERILRKAPWTSQKKVEYRHKILVHLIGSVTETDADEAQSFYSHVADAEAITGCSHDKAIEYLDAFSTSYYAPFQKVHLKNGDVKIVRRLSWNPKFATEEYKKAMDEVQEEQATSNTSRGEGP